MNTSLYQFNLADDQSLHVVVTATENYSLTVILLDELCKIVQYPFVYSNNSAYVDIPTCNFGIHNLRVESMVPQNLTITITQTTGTILFYLFN